MISARKLSKAGFQLCTTQVRSYYNASNKVNREGKIWREKHKLAAHINQTKQLFEGADYRFLDGRPTPYGVRQYKRMEIQRSLAEKMVDSVQQINFAVERYNRIENAKKNEIKNILDRKLKPKGGFLK